MFFFLSGGSIAVNLQALVDHRDHPTNSSTSFSAISSFALCKFFWRTFFGLESNCACEVSNEVRGQRLVASMMEEALGWAGGGLTPGALVMIKDCVAAKGGFLLTFFLKKLLASSEGSSGLTRVVFVAMAEPFSHYGRIAKKQGCNLIQARDNGQFVFLDMMAASNPIISQHRTEQVASPLQMLYQIVKESVKKMQTGNVNDRTVIMVDDASLLEISAGGRSDQVLALLQYCRAIRSGNDRCSIVVLVHGDTDVTYTAAGLDNGGYVEHGEQRVASLVQELDHIADVMISVDPLSTGLSNDVHGQVTVVHWSDVLSNRESRKGVQTLQFKLMENNTTFFHPGGRF